MSESLSGSLVAEAASFRVPIDGLLLRSQLSADDGVRADFIIPSDASQPAQMKGRRSARTTTP